MAFACYDEAEQTTVQISGAAEIVDDPEIRQIALNSMYRFTTELSGVEIPPIEKLFAGEYVAVRIVPETIKMAIFLRPDSEGIVCTTPSFSLRISEMGNLNIARLD